MPTLTERIQVKNSMWFYQVRGDRKLHCCLCRRSRLLFWTLGRKRVTIFIGDEHTSPEAIAMLIKCWSPLPTTTVSYHIQLMVVKSEQLSHQCEMEDFLHSWAFTTHLSLREQQVDAEIWAESQILHRIWTKVCVGGILEHSFELGEAGCWRFRRSSADKERNKKQSNMLLNLAHLSSGIYNAPPEFEV